MNQKEPHVVHCIVSGLCFATGIAIAVWKSRFFWLWEAQGVYEPLTCIIYYVLITAAVAFVLYDIELAWYFISAKRQQKRDREKAALDAFREVFAPELQKLQLDEDDYEHMQRRGMTTDESEI